jgi:hypothetical protein
VAKPKGYRADVRSARATLAAVLSGNPLEQPARPHTGELGIGSEIIGAGKINYGGVRTTGHDPIERRAHGGSIGEKPSTQ